VSLTAATRMNGHGVVRCFRIFVARPCVITRGLHHIASSE
jgi:hypothetical protein